MESATRDGLFRVSIDAFYDGRLAVGRLACDRLLNLPDLPAAVRSATRANQLFYAPTLAEIASGLRDAPIEAPVRPGWARFNPTIAADGDAWLAFLRTSNFRLEPPETYIVTDAGPNVHTAYLRLRYDADLRPIADPSPVADLTDAAGRRRFKVQDYEDCRLVRLGARWLASAMARDRNPDGVCQIALLDFDPDASTFSNLRLLSPGGAGLHEKNWMPFVDDDALGFVYGLAPTAILACDPDSGGVDLARVHDAPYAARDLRGGSQLVAVDDGWLCLVHDVIRRDRGDKVYLHRFVQLDQTFQIAAMSHPFRFRATSIEFASGLARRGDTLALTYGVDDREAWIADLPLADALDLLWPVADLAPNGRHAFPLPPGLLAVLERQSPPPAPPANADAPVLRPKDGGAAMAPHVATPEAAAANGFTPFPPAPSRLVSVTLAGDGNAALIGDALRSVVDWVDACIVLDTGIADDALAVARDVAGDKLVVHAFPWIDDFAAARNAALEAAAASGAAWAVILDTDERIDCRDFDIQASLAAVEADVLLVAHAGGTYAKERFFRLPARGRFHGPTHEAFLANGPRAELAGPVFREEPKSADGYRRKAERDLAILTRHTADHPDDPRWFYYLGDALANLQRQDEAIAAFERCWALKGWDEEGAWAMYRAAKCWLELGERDRAVEACAAGMARHAGLAELPWMAAFASWQAGRSAQAVYWARQAAAMGLAFGAGEAVPRIGFRHPPALYEGPYDVLRYALRRLGDDAGAAEAERQYQQARAMREGRAAPAVDAKRPSGDRHTALLHRP